MVGRQEDEVTTRTIVKWLARTHNVPGQGTSVRVVGLRDRFFTPTTAKAIMSWRAAVGIAVAVAMGFAGVPIWLAIGLGVGVTTGLVLAAMPGSRDRRPAVDPFVLSEPALAKLRFVHDTIAESARRQKLIEIVRQ